MSAATMVPGIAVGVRVTRAFVQLKGQPRFIAPLSYSVMSVVSFVYHLAAIHEVDILRADLMAQQLTCAITGWFTPCGVYSTGTVFIIAVVSSRLNLQKRRHRIVAYLLNACAILASSMTTRRAIAMWLFAFSLFGADFLRPNVWTHGGLSFGRTPRGPRSVVL